MAEPIPFHLVANARYHDTDFARLELLTLLAEHPEIRTTVASSFSDTDRLAKAQVLITYTCDLRPSDTEQEALAEFVAGVAANVNCVARRCEKMVTARRQHIRQLVDLIFLQNSAS